MAQKGFAIIAGSNKCGTTSLFRYLSDHPAVCPSKRKELMFFSSPHSGSPHAILQEYGHEFTRAGPDSTIFLEASPQYLHVGHQRAAAIRTVLPSARLLFILRDPVARLISYYRSDYGQPKRPSYGYTFEQVVDLGLAGLAGADSRPSARSFAQEIRMAHYAEYLQEYAEVWPTSQMKIVFFEQFAAQVLQEMIEVARYLGIDPGYYEQYNFEVENRTRGHRYAAVQRIALTLNDFLEPIFVNRVELKRWLRGIYNRFNETERRIVIEETAVAKLRDHYAASVRQLRAWFASNFPRQVLPDWLT